MTTTMPLILVAKGRSTTTISLRSVWLHDYYYYRRSSSSSRPAPLNQSLLSVQQQSQLSTNNSTVLLQPSFDLDNRCNNSNDDDITMTTLAHRKRRRPMQMGLLVSASASPVVRGSHQYAFGNNAAGFSQQQQQQHYPTRRTIRSVSTWVALPEVLQDMTMWGGSGWMLKTLHTTFGLEYWSCFAATSVIIRLGLSPFVLYGAHTASRFAKIVPEVQFLVTLFTNDMNKLRQSKRPALLEKAILMKTNMQTLSAIYKLHKIHPFSIFISPLLQMVFLSYISIDLRKIINGRDPLLAQELVDAGTATAATAVATTTVASATDAVMWPTTPFPWLLPGDLTEPDPWFGLPILAGIIMYANIEVAMGRKSLTGPATAKADTGVLIKDMFQSLAIFMPCFTSQLPCGIQIYLVTSFLYTMAQSVVLRNEAFRAYVGLPVMTLTAKSSSNIDPSSLNNEAAATVEGQQQGVGGKYALQFIQLKQLEQQAKDVRGKDGPLLGKYVLAHGWEISFPGEYRKSSINTNIDVGDDNASSLSSQRRPPLEPIAVPVFHAMATSRGQTLRQMLEQQQTGGGAFVHGVTAPLWQLEQQQKEWLAQQQQQPQELDRKQVVVVDNDNNREVIPDVADEIMEKANRGQLPVATATIKAPQSKSTSTNVKGPIDLNAKKLQNKSGKKNNRSGGKNRR